MPEGEIPTLCRPACIRVRLCFYLVTTVSVVTQTGRSTAIIEWAQSAPVYTPTRSVGASCHVTGATRERGAVIFFIVPSVPGGNDDGFQSRARKQAGKNKVQGAGCRKALLYL